MSAQSKQSDLLNQHCRALDLLCGLHPCITIDGPPEEVAQLIFDHVQARDREQQERITNLSRSLETLHLKGRTEIDHE